MDGVFCGNAKCQQALNEPSDIPFDDRQPCPQCGSLQRQFRKSTESSIGIYSSLNAIGKRRGLRRPFIEMFSGHQMSTATGRWKRKYRVIDRVNDHYQEEVSDLETDKLEHFQEEPLSDHWGHGSAKK